MTGRLPPKMTPARYAREVKKYKAWTENWNKRIAAERVELIEQITTLQPSVVVAKLYIEAADGGNMRLDEILQACKLVAKVM